MNEVPRSEGPGGCDVIAGLFVILFGLCITLLGGGCTFMWLLAMTQSDLGSGLPLLLVSLGIFAGGIAVIWVGVRLMSGKFR